MEDLKRWLVLLRIPAVLLGIFFFFSFYNRFILDANLRHLQSSLSILDTATGVGQAEAALLLVDQTLVTQMAKEEVDLTTLSTLQYAQGVLGSDQPQRPVTDAQFLMQTVTEEQALDRPAFLKSMDDAVVGAQNAFRGIGFLPRQLFGARPGQTLDPIRLQQAQRWEQQGKIEQAARGYQSLLKDYPRCDERGQLSLRLGRLHEILQAFDEAKRSYQDALHHARNVREADVAREMLRKLGGIRNQHQKIGQLRKKLERMGPGQERQETAHTLGVTLLQIQNLTEAAAAFRDAYEAYPEGPLALTCVFKEGWCFKRIGQFDDAFERFLDVIRKSPGSSWAAASYQQMAEVYKTTGDYKSAVETYERILSSTEDYAFKALTLAQAGSTCLFDLNDSQKAQVYFQELAKSFPASPFAAIQNRLVPVAEGLSLETGPFEPESAAEEKRPAGNQLAVGTPLMKWIENFLPIFVDVFATRLARYMQISEEKQLTRRYTQEEFRALVVRRVQEKFPGQVTDVNTEIHEEGFIGSGTVKIGPLAFAVKARIGIKVKDDRPFTSIYEIKVGPLSLPGPLLRYLETRVNATIERAKYPIRVKQYELREGYAIISVELMEADTSDNRDRASQ